jgi:hypothetical protein
MYASVCTYLYVCWVCTFHVSSFCVFFIPHTHIQSFFRQLRNQPHKHDVIMLPSNITGIEVLYTIQNSHLCDIPCVVYAYERANLNRSVGV